MTQLHLSLIGTFDVCWGAGPSINFPTDKVRALFAYLALEGERPLRRETLATLLWPDYTDPISRRNLRQNLHRLTHLLNQLEPGLSQQLLTITRPTIQFHPHLVWLDVAELNQRLTAVANHPHRHLHTCTTCLDTLHEAEQLANGDLLSGITLPDAPLFEEWLAIQREQLHYQSLQLRHALTDIHLQRGDFEQACHYASQQIQLEPWREEAHRQMMLALARQGQRSKALAQYATCCQLLEAEMGLSPSSETISLYETIVDESLPPLPAAITSALHHFPTTFTPFIGREAECEQIITHLQNPDCRLLTLTAPGGMGKTRLVIHAICHTLAKKQQQPVLFPDGAYFIPLAEVTTAAQLLSMMAQAFDLPTDSSEQQVADYLHDKQLLLVLDNFEQLQTTAVTLTTLLQQAPHLSLLVTSRVPLGVQAEWVLPIEGLSYPLPADTAKPTAVGLQQYPAIQLFNQAARRADPCFQLNEANRTAVSQICQLVNGMPLALEMAASWLRLLDCAQIASQIRHNLDFLAVEGGDWPNRHRSMRALLQQSWAFLSVAEQKAVAQMAHFSGHFNLEAALAVTDVTLPMLRLLLDEAWVQRLENGRYTLHPLIHQFAAEQLTAQPELVATTQQAHSRYYLQLLQGYGAALHGPHAQSVLQELRSTQPNLVLAWQTAVAQQQWPLLQESHQSLADYHLITGQISEGIALFALALEPLDETADPFLVASLRLDQARLLVEQGKLPQANALLEQVADCPAIRQSPSLWAQWHMENGRLQELLGHYPPALESLHHALAHYQQSGNSLRQAQTIGIIGNVYWRQGRYDDALTQFHHALAIATNSGDLAYQAILLSNIGIIYVDMSDFKQGLAYYQRALALDTELGNRAHIARHTFNIARVYRLQGQLALALEHFQQALTLAEELGLRRGISLCVTNIGIVYKERGQYAEAETAYQRALHLARELHLPEGEADNLGNLANLYRLMGRHEVAADYYAQALQCSRVIGFREGEARQLGNMAELHMIQQEWELARPLFDEAIAILREMGESYMLASLLILQAETLLTLGDVTAVAPLLEEGITLAQQTGRDDYLAQGRVLAQKLAESSEMMRDT